MLITLKTDFAALRAQLIDEQAKREQLQEYIKENLRPNITAMKQDLQDELNATKAVLQQEQIKNAQIVEWIKKYIGPNAEKLTEVLENIQNKLRKEWQQKYDEDAISLREKLEHEWNVLEKKLDQARIQNEEHKKVWMTDQEKQRTLWEKRFETEISVWEKSKEQEKSIWEKVQEQAWREYQQKIAKVITTALPTTQPSLANPTTPVIQPLQTTQITTTVPTSPASTKRTPVSDWLERENYSQYNKEFHENGYDKLDVVAEISESDLDILGIKLLGHRKGLLTAVKLLKEERERSEREKQDELERRHRERERKEKEDKDKEKREEEKEEMKKKRNVYQI